MRTSRHTANDAASAAAGILDRRIRLGRDASTLPDVDDLFGVLRYVTSHPRVPHPILEQDVQAQLVIIGYLRTELDRRQISVMGTAHTVLRVPWSRLAGWLGLRTAQAAEQTWLRLRSAHRVGGGPRSDRAARADRATIIDRPRVEALPRARLRLLLAVVGHLRELSPLVPDDLAEDLQGLGQEDTAAATLAMVRGIIRDLRSRRDLTPAVVSAAAEIIAAATPLMDDPVRR